MLLISGAIAVTGLVVVLVARCKINVIIKNQSLLTIRTLCATDSNNLEETENRKAVRLSYHHDHRRKENCAAIPSKESKNKKRPLFCPR